MATARAAVELDTVRIEAPLARRRCHVTQHVALPAARAAQDAIVREVADEPREQRPPRIERVGVSEGSGAVAAWHALAFCLLQLLQL